MDSSVKVTIQELARLAGVTKGTVSKVLNNRPGIKAETRTRVLDLARSLDYAPNPAARALARQRSFNLGLMVPRIDETSLGGSYWPAVVSAVAAHVSRERYNLMLFTPEEERDIRESCESIVRARSVDGLIIGAQELDEEGIALLETARLPFVILGAHENPLLYTVDIDNYRASRMIMNHIHSRGFSATAMLSGPLDLDYNKKRAAGYRDSMQDAGTVPMLVSASGYHPQQGRASMRRLLEEFPHADSIYIGAGADFGFSALEVLKSSEGLRPEGLGIVLFDDYPYLDYYSPPLTALRQPIGEMARAAVNLLRDLLEGKMPENRSLLLEPGLILRGSCRD